MKDIFVYSMATICTLAALIGLGWLLTGNDLILKKYFAPKYEEVKRETFEQSKEYVQGTIQELYKMQTEYMKSNDDDFKRALASRALFVSSSFDKNLLPNDIAIWLNSL